MDLESKLWIYKFFSVLNPDELIDILKEFYESSLSDGVEEIIDFEDTIKWTLAEHEEIEMRIK